MGRLRLPRRATTLRLALVALLLVTAAGVLYAGGDDPVTAGPPSPAPSPVPADLLPTVPGAGEPPRLPIPAGLVGAPVRLGDPTGLVALRPGDRVDLLAVPEQRGEPVAVADNAPVLAVDRAAAALLLALTPEQARTVVAAPAATSFAVIVRP